MQEVGATRPFEGGEIVRRKLLHSTLRLGSESTSLSDASPFVMLPDSDDGVSARCEILEGETDLDFEILAGLHA